MSTRGLAVAGAVLAVSFGTWAGLRLYCAHRVSAPQVTAAGKSPAASPAMRVPVGEASPPTPGDSAPLEPGLSMLPRIPARLPDFSLRDQAGKLTSVAAWRGKSLVINFWATWCTPCRHEIPLLKSLDDAWRGQDVQVLGIAVDRRDQVLAYADELKITYPLLIGEEDGLDAAAALGVTEPAFPFTVFADRRGEVVALYMGELHRPEASLILSVVQDLNRDRMQLPQARQAISEGLRRLHAEDRS